MTTPSEADGASASVNHSPELPAIAVGTHTFRQLYLYAFGHQHEVAA